MNIDYLSLFGALPEPLALARRQALLRLISVFIGIAVTLALMYIVQAIYQIWQVWPSLWRPSLDGISTNVSYGTLPLGGAFMLLCVELFTLVVPGTVVGPFGRPRPALTFTQALLAAIAARDPDVAPAVNIDQPAKRAPDEFTEQLIEHRKHPLADASSNADYIWGVLCGIGIVGILVWGGPGSAFSFLLSALDPAIVTLHNPFLSWLSAYRFVLGMLSIFLPLMLGACWMIAWMLIALHYARIAGRGMTARVNAEGIQAQFIGARSMLWAARWDEVTGFARLRCRDKARQNYDVYLLLAGKRVLLWESQPSDELAAAITRYTPVPLVQVSRILRASNRGASSGNPPINWNLLNDAALIAQGKNDQQLLQEIWEKLHPGKSAPRARRWINAFIVDSTGASARADTLHAAKALLPYYSTREEARAALHTSFLSRGYARFTFSILAFMGVYWASAVVFMLILYNHR